MSPETTTADSGAAKSPEKKTVFASKAPAKTYNFKQLTVLLAEDTPSMQSLISSMLKTFEVGEVLIASSGAEAQGLISITQSKRRSGDVKGIDIILTDMLMPDGSGIDLIRWVRAHKDDEIRFLPILLISAHTTKRVVAEARDHGANEALVKPISGGKLASRILGLIDTPRPFIKTADFFGPDRRRQNLAFEGEDRRKISAEEIHVHKEHL